MSTLIDVDESDASSAFAPRKTRWDELLETMKIIVQVATMFDKDGVDIYFLNREPHRKVTTIEQITSAFSYQPEGYTPIVKCLKHILQEKQVALKERKVLLVLATDG